MRLDDLPGTGKVLGEALSAAVLLGSLAQILPPLAALFSIIWTTIRIFESDTVQALIRRRKDRL